MAPLSSVPKELERAVFKYNKARKGSRKRFFLICEISNLKIIFSQHADTIKEIDNLRNCGPNFEGIESILDKKCEEILSRNLG